MSSHCHRPAYLGIVLKGAYSETVSSRTRLCNHLTTIFHPAGESHSVVFHNGGARIFRVEFGEGSNPEISSYARIPDEPADFKGGLLASLGIRLYNEYRNRDAWSALAIDGLLLEILAELSRQKAKAQNRQIHGWLDEVKETLASRVADTPSLAELAEDVGVHPVHLAREFRKRFDCTIGEFVRRRRVEMACEQMASSSLPMAEIALSLGFCDQSHFSNTFKRLTGMTPATYRASCRPG
jgi:AraC family transcriptional regulator